MTRVTMPASALRRVARAVAPAASRDDARQLLTGVMIEATADRVRFAATDSYRLHVASFDPSLPDAHVTTTGYCKAVIPAEFLMRWAKTPVAKPLDVVQIRVYRKSVTLRAQTWNGPEGMSTRLIPPMPRRGDDNGEPIVYPDIDSIMALEDEPEVGVSAFNEEYLGGVIAAAKGWRPGRWSAYPIRVMRMGALKPAIFRVDCRDEGVLDLCLMPVRVEGLNA